MEGQIDARMFSYIPTMDWLGDWNDQNPEIAELFLFDIHFGWVLRGKNENSSSFGGSLER